MNLPKKQLYIVLAILGIVILGFAGYIYLKPTEQINPPPPPNGTVQEGHYRNEEYGFGFDYPDEWEVRDDIFGPSYYSKLTLVITPNIREQYPTPILVNVVLPEFIDSSFGNLEKTVNEITVDGVKGKKYEYEFEGHSEIAVILPLGKFSIILGNQKEIYREEFNQFLESFELID